MNTLSNVPDTINRFSDKLPSISTENIKAPEFTLPEPKSFLMNGWTILTIILILGLLGFNIFTYLAKGTDMFGNTIKSLADIFTFGAKNTLETSEKGTNVLNKEIKKTSAEIGTGINRTVDNSATGSKTAVDVVADAALAIVIVKLFAEDVITSNVFVSKSDATYPAPLGGVTDVKVNRSPANRP